MLKLECVVVTLLFLINGSFSQSDSCGVAPLNTRIVGGQSTTNGMWPWQVSLQKFSQHFCGGTLINKDWVMTAAHCFSSFGASRVVVYLGKLTLQGTNPYEVTRSISKIYRNPSYNSNTNDNDVTLLRLSSSVTFTDYIRPVCLADGPSVFPGGTGCWITGWGNIGYGGSNRFTTHPMSLPSPGYLQEAQVSVVENALCDSLLGPGLVTANMICAGQLQGGTGVCQGDSGGPLVVKQNSVWIQIGITSWGRGCALPDLPAAFSRVSQFKSWISSTIKTNLPGFVTYTPPA